MAAYGSWPSEITSELVVRAAAGLADVQIDPTDGSIWWSESRPDQGGRIALIRQEPSDNGAVDRLPDTQSARTRVHEYGGRAWWVDHGTVWYTAWDDQRIWRRSASDPTPIPVTPEPPLHHGYRYADGVVTPDGQWIICVREAHCDPDGTPLDQARNEIVAIPASPPERGSGPPSVTVLVTGPDFVSSPRLDPSGTRLVWLAWDHPRMPWDGTELFIADLAVEDPGTPELANVKKLAGGTNEALIQPEWTKSGRLLVVSDRTEWWNLYQVDPTTGELTPLGPVEAEVATPPWVFGQSRYVVDEDRGRIVAALIRQGTDALALIADGQVTELATPYSAWSALRLDSQGRVVAIAAAADSEPAVVRVDVEAPDRPIIDIRRAPRDLGLDPAWFSTPEAISFPTSGGRVAHGLYYRPTNPTVTPPADERPPLLVMIHGGPTGAARSQLNLATQFWTSRGFAVVDVNYGGSTGYGRPFRQQLQGQWGIVDVDDCEAAARYLAERGDVDPHRLLIRGGSAGGFTTLAALAFRDTFAAGASQYGVADLAALAADTHKFESRYLDGLVGPYPAAADIYRQRSPINHLDGFNKPLIVFQGLEDEIVPPNQSEMIVEALAAKGVRVAYVPFAGEQHGFRQAANIQRALEAELWFYGQILGFDPADEIEPVPMQGI